MHFEKHCDGEYDAFHFAIKGVNMTPEQFQYHLAEYTSLKDELAQTFQDAYQVVLISITANAAIISFLTTATFGDAFYSILHLSQFLPLFLSLVGLFLFEMRRRSVKKITKYLYLIEEKLAEPSLGWERYYAADIDQRPFFVRTPFVLRSAMWLQVGYTAAFPFVASLDASVVG